MIYMIFACLSAFCAEQASTEVEDQGVQRLQNNFQETQAVKFQDPTDLPAVMMHLNKCEPAKSLTSLFPETTGVDVQEDASNLPAVMMHLDKCEPAKYPTSALPETTNVAVQEDAQTYLMMYLDS